MSIQHAEFVLYIAGLVAFAFWLAHIWIWWTIRKPVQIEPITTEIAGKSPGIVRELLPKAATLQTPAWELIGGDTQTAVFRISGKEHLTKNVSPFDVEITAATGSDPQDTQLTMTFDPAITDDHRPLGFAPVVMWFWMALITPLISAGLLIWLWQFIHHASNDAMRMQAIQCSQLIHILWPPFLFLGFHVMKKKTAKQLVDQFIKTLTVL